MSDLDQAFSNGEWNITVSNVGDLIDELSRLPRDTPVNQGFSKSVDVIVFNRSSNVHVSFDEGGSTW